MIPATAEAPAHANLDARSVAERVWQLRQLHLPYLTDRGRIRDIMNGGRAGLVALLGPKIADREDLIPAANLVLTGSTRLAQKVGKMPLLKIPAPVDSETQRQHELAQKREDVVRTYDQWSRIRMHMPQIGRWLPGYGFFVWVIRDRLDRDGNPYPHAQLRDPYDAYPGSWGVDQIPRELATARKIPLDTIQRKYPWVGKIRLDRTTKLGRWGAAGGTVVGMASSTVGDARWDTLQGEGELVAEYYDDEASWLILAEYGIVLDYRPNVSPWCPQFVVGKRFTFDALTGQYGHALGLQMAQAKLNMLSVIAMQDAVFAETNVMGDAPRGGKYRKGRDATNYFAQGTRVEKNVGSLPYQMFQEIDRMERQLRNQVGYPVTDDAESPVGYATGAAVNELQGSVTAEVAEYQLVIADALQRLDYARLAWDEKAYGSRYRKRLYRHLYTYDPKFIDGAWDTERVYGVMAGFDEPQKIVTGLQLLEAGVLDLQTLAENLDGVDDWYKIDQRNQARAARDFLYEVMTQQGIAGSPNAIATFIDLLPPGDVRQVFEKYFMPDEDGQPTPEQQALGGGVAEVPPALPGAPQPGGQEDLTTQTVLSQLGLSGDIKGGSQVVARV